MSVARRSLSTTRRSLLTASAAGALLSALWFVPSANATSAGAAEATRTAAVASADLDEQAREATARSEPAADTRDTALADTGSIDTTPYVVGGTLFLGLGAGFMVFSKRREQRYGVELPLA